MRFKNQKLVSLHFVLILILLSGMVWIVPVERVHAATLIVTNNSDSGAGSLRQAVIDAAPGDTITFDPSLAGQTIALSSQINLEKNLTIDSSGLDPTIAISGSLGARIFYIASGSTVTLQSLTLKEGRNHSGSGGGAIYNDGNLTVIDSTFTNNASAGYGGAIHNVNGLHVENSTFVGNSAQAGGAVFVGNGIFSNIDVTPTIMNSTFVSNQANATNGSGGGVYNAWNTSGPGTSLVLTNNTFSENSAYTGGGLYNSGSLSYSNNIFANSTSGGDCFSISLGGTVYGTNNLIENGSYCPHDYLVRGDPMLGPLSANGGPTLTMALLPGSPAIDAGTATCLSTDQRGVTRPQGAACEIGAYEYEYHSVTYYVKWNASGANNGTSWTDAYTDLQSALSSASSGDEIWVAAGTYKPTTSTDRTVSFTLKNGVAIYGGFAGIETLRTQRDFTANVTVLSGDIGIPHNNGDNSYHVVIGSNTNTYAKLDGFTVTGGNANVSPHQKGGGIYVNKGNLTIMNTIFANNFADLGGGMYSSGEYSSPPNASKPMLTNVIFQNNSAVSGGGMRNENYSNSILINVVFRNNTVTRTGGGMENFEYSSPTLTNVTFEGNTAGAAGGGMFNWVGNISGLMNVTFRGNSAEWGGGMGNYQSSPFLTNITFSGNSASTFGGGMSNESNSSPTLTNVTFSGNSAITYGGAIYNDAYGSTPNIANSILYGDSGGEIHDVSGESFVTHSIVQGGYPGSGNLDADPLLGPLADNGGLTQTMALGMGSPAIDAGINGGCPATDQRGVTRPQGNHCDMGSYEFDGPFVPTPTVTATATQTQTAMNTPLTNCNQITAGPITISGNSMRMSITNPLTLPVQIQDVFVVWNHDKGHLAGNDKTLNLTSVSLDGTIWSGISNGPSAVIIPSATAYIPTGTSSILFNFHQSYELFDGTEELLINLATNGCQSYPIASNSIATNTPTATLTPTSTLTPTVTPPYSYNPLYLSLSSNQTVGGVASADEDILRFDGTNWSLHFDGSDVGVASSDLFGFSIVDSNTILMAFSSAVTVNGLAITPQDVVRFESTSLGTNTVGSFYMYLDGSDVGLDTTAEKLDSVSLLPDGRVLVSTTGNPAVVGVTGGRDEDVLAFNPATGTWAMYFDGSDVGLGETSGEDTDALDVMNSKVYLSTADNFSVNGVSGADEDVFVCNSFVAGEATSCSYSPALYFDGSTWNLAASDVDAFHLLTLDPVPISTPTHTPTVTKTSTATLAPTSTPTKTSTATSTPTSTPTLPMGVFEVRILSHEPHPSNPGEAVTVAVSVSDIGGGPVGNVTVNIVSDEGYTSCVTVDMGNSSVCSGVLKFNNSFGHLIRASVGGDYADVDHYVNPVSTNTPTATQTPTVTATFTPSATLNASDLIFKDSFESGSLSAWTSNTNDLGDLNVSSSAALSGSYGLQAAIDDANTIYVTDDTPNGEPRYRARFYFDPNSITMTSGDAHFIFKGFTVTGTDVLQVEFRNSAGAYQIRGKLMNDASSFVVTNWFNISDAPHAIEVNWRAATAVGANNGGLTLWIDGVQQADLAGIDNDTWRIDRVRLGALAGMDAGTRGTYYFDAFESRR